MYEVKVVVRVRGLFFVNLVNRSLRWSSNVTFIFFFFFLLTLKSNIIPRCFWGKVWETLLLKSKGGCVGLFTQIWIETHFPLERPRFFKSSINSFTKVLTSWTTKNVSLAKSYWRTNYPINRRSLTIEHYPKLSTTLCFLFPKKSDKICGSSPKMSFDFNLEIIPPCQTSSKALDMSKKTLLTSNQWPSG